MPTLEGYNELRSSVAGVAWPGLRAFRFTGADTVEWLQGQVTNDLRRLTESHPVAALLVKPTGQLLESLTLVRRQEGLIVVAEGGTELLARVESFVILEDLVIEEIGAVSNVLFGPESHNVKSSSAVPWCLAGMTGWGEFDVVPEVASASLDSFSALTLEESIPLGLLDADAKTFPSELGEAFDRNTVAYDKGCYFGQEVLQRLHSRGHTNREWRVVRVEGTVIGGEAVTDTDGANLGKVTRYAVSPREGHLCGALLHSKRIETGQTVKIGSVAGTIL